LERKAEREKAADEYVQQYREDRYWKYYHALSIGSVFLVSTPSSVRGCYYRILSKQMKEPWNLKSVSPENGILNYDRDPQFQLTAVRVEQQNDAHLNEITSVMTERLDRGLLVLHTPDVAVTQEEMKEVLDRHEIKTQHSAFTLVFIDTTPLIIVLIHLILTYLTGDSA
jgi:hypothetical protein